MLLAGLLCIFLALAIALTTVGVLTSERQQVARSLAAVRSTSSAPMVREAEPTFGDRVVKPASARFTSLGRRFTPTGQVERIRMRLEMAGSPARWDTDRILAFKSLGLLAGAAFGAALPLLLGGGLFVCAGLGILLGLGGYYAPDLVLYQKAYERREQIQRDLP
ncbi:MAG: tight adherence protein, partial [Frankiaceae bacterium]|nr:tight adherence protein [Frankiaceae bacterium]